MARSRLGVAILVPPPLADEVNGLRRALGDPTLPRVPPHLTLVPPVNVRDDELGRALAVLRSAAAGAPAALRLELGPPASFLPVNPVLYLEVSGDLEAVEALRGRVLVPPLARSLTWPFVPHVTVADDADPERIAAGATVLGDYRAATSVDRVHLLRETRRQGARHWDPVADAAFGPPAVIGRGGLALELTRSHLLDPEAAAVVAVVCGRPQPAGPPDPASCVVVTGRREGVVAGVAAAWLGDDGGEVAVLVDARYRRQGIGSHLLAAVESAVKDAAWSSSHLRAIGPGAFYAARSRFSVAGAQAPDPATRSGSTNSG
jgi:2'-5' RNA ligase/GNAT superfamily N-acetyltransferase